ncbi:hypothetical protein [Nonomuraea sp. CA-141351]|uniref:hypothetical protein n=1 Tax=Nonomuraea sp. CA-141351 TaxID=3239996 RepID=UPI003D8A6B25
MSGFWRGQRTAYWNNAVGPSPVFRACACTLPAGSASAEAKSFSPHALAISQVCSSRVLSRSVWLLHAGGVLDPQRHR